MAQKLTMKFREMAFLIFVSLLFFTIDIIRPKDSHFGNVVHLGLLEITGMIEKVYNEFYKKD